MPLRNCLYEILFVNHIFIHQNLIKMKKVFSIAIICCLVAVTGIFSSCKPREDGDWLYAVKVDPSTESSLQNNFEVFAYPTIAESMKADADSYTESSRIFTFRGEKKEVAKRAEESFNKAITKVESREGYNQPIVLGGIKVNLLRTNRDTNKEEVVYSRTLKE